MAVHPCTATDDSWSSVSGGPMGFPALLGADWEGRVGQSWSGCWRHEYQERGRACMLSSVLGHQPLGKRHRVSTLYNARAACEGLRLEVCGWPAFYLHVYRMTRCALLQALSA